MKTINIAGLNLSATTKQEFLEALSTRIKNSEKTFVTTPYSEFLYEAFKKPKLFDLLNSADFSVADGIGMLWAATFLSLPLKAKSYYGKIFESLWQIIYTQAAILFYPVYIKKQLPEKIVGANLIFDLAELAQKNNWSIYLLGGFGNTSELAAKKLQNKFPNLKIAGWSNKNPQDIGLIEEINRKQVDLLFVAFGPIKQEVWISENLPNLKVKLAIGLGGTFDYIAGKRKAPPKFIRLTGLEWLWRLITQPSRWRRIYNAIYGFTTLLLRYKVFSSMPIRINAAAVILNSKNEVLVCERSPEDFYVDIIDDGESLKKRGYWQLPQGGAENNEDIVQAARREVKEEIGLENLELLSVSKKTNTYIWNNALRKLFKNRTYRNKGQVQHVVYFKYLGPNEAVKIDKHEFIGFKWIGAEEMESVIHPERISLVKIVIEDLKELFKSA